MRILHIIYDDIKNPWLAGGGAQATHEIHKRLSKIHDITVATGNYPGAKTGVIDGVRYIRVGKPHKRYFLSRLAYMLNLRKTIKQNSHDLLIDDFSPFTPSFSILHTKKPIIAVMRNDMGFFDPIRRYNILGPAIYLIHRLSFKTFNYYIPNSPAMEKIILRHKRKKAIVKYLPRGVNVKEFNPNGTESKYILYIGRIDIYEKGIDVMLEAFSTIPDKEIKLIIAGSGTEEHKQKLKEMMNRLELKERVQTVGKKVGEDKKALLSNCLFVCIPTRYGVWGSVPAEAGASRKAVLATTVLCDSVIKDKTGIIVEPGNALELSQGMIKLINDKKLRNDLGKEGREYAESLDWDKVIENYDDFLKKVIKQDKNPQTDSNL
jgi:glycosyltransferase involved in cell wall biosynthesis